MNLGGQYIFDLGGGATLTACCAWTTGHIAARWATLFHRATDRLTARDIVNAPSWPGSGVTTSSALYSTNLTGQRYLASVATLR